MNAVKVILTVVTACLYINCPSAYGQMVYQALPESELYIEGDATLRDYSCQADTLEASVRFPDSAAVSNQVPEVRLSIRVRAFECGLRPMNRDLYQALKAEQHPSIEFQLRTVQRVGPADSTGWHPVRILGDLTIAGQTRTVQVDLMGRYLSNNEVRVRGAHTISMGAFGVEPPTALGGLIRAKDSVTVRFDLQAAPVRQSFLSSHSQTAGRM